MVNEFNDGDEPKLIIAGYKQKGLEVIIACNHPAGVVLSIGDKRMELTRKQLICLSDLVQQFLLAKTEL